MTVNLPNRHYKVTRKGGVTVTDDNGNLTGAFVIFPTVYGNDISQIDAIWVIALDYQLSIE